MNPFPLNRLVRVHRVHVLGLSTPKMVPGHGHLASSPTQPVHVSHRGRKAIDQRRAVPQGNPCPPPSWVVGGCRVA